MDVLQHNKSARYRHTTDAHGSVNFVMLASPASTL
jgi:hypothetical protein